MATVAAVRMADVLKRANVGSLPLLLGFIAVVGIVGLATSDWLYGRMSEFAWSDRAASVVASTTKRSAA